MTTLKNKTVSKIFIIAGESSGDLIGGRLMSSLKDQSGDRSISFQGVGGDLMAAEGLSSLFPMQELAVMGITEILPHIPKLLGRINQVADAIIEQKPDLVVTIDAPGFCFRVLKKLRKRMGDDCPQLVHYVAPTVWAWKPKRALKVSKFLDSLLVILPFEPPYFEVHGLETHFVGHHVLDAGADQGDGATFRQKNNISADEKLLCLLPGSRMGEVTRMLPIFKEVTENLHQKFPALQLVLPVVSHVKEYIQAETQDWDIVPTLVAADAKYDAFSASDLALITSGTVSVEVAMAKLPMVVAYKMNAFTIFLIRRMTKMKYVSLINIIPNKEILPEFIQENCEASKITTKMLTLLSRKKMRDKQVTDAQKILQTMRYKDQSASARAAAILLEKL
ncbi:MAG: lipid-A-disaccharide synthase [Alphaproteobacteria bacterium]